MDDSPIRARVLAGDRGSLYVLDSEDLPFTPERVFFVEAPPGTVRGHHAHHSGEQLLIVVAGSVSVTTIDVSGHSCARDLGVGQGLRLPALTWSTQEFNREGSVLLVLCDSQYDESDYIRDWQEFRQIQSARAPSRKSIKD